MTKTEGRTSSLRDTWVQNERGLDLGRGQTVTGDIDDICRSE